MTSRPRSSRTTAAGRWSLVLALVLTAWVAAGCGVTRADEANDMTMMIPNSPGGGYDQTGRAAVSVMERDKILDGSFEVTGQHNVDAFPVDLGIFHPARYSGRMHGADRLTMEAVLLDTGRRLGPAEAFLGREPQLRECPICAAGDER